MTGKRPLPQFFANEIVPATVVGPVDVATYDFITSAVNGEVITGEHVYDLKNDGVGYATSGGQVDDIVTDLDAAAAEIVAGTVTVPTTTS